jgi:hypothetical protein
MPQTTDMYNMFKLLVIWMLVLFASATSCHLIARHQFRKCPVEYEGEHIDVD